VLVAEGDWGFGIVSEVGVVASASVAVVLGRGSKENVGLACDTEEVVVFWAWLAAGSCGEEDPTTGGGTDTVMYVVDVLVTVPICWSPNVQKDVGAPLIRLLHGFEDVPSLLLASRPVG
jgi:hypothetical protein